MFGSIHIQVCFEFHPGIVSSIVRFPGSILILIKFLVHVSALIRSQWNGAFVYHVIRILYVIKMVVMKVDELSLSWLFSPHCIAVHGISFMKNNTIRNLVP